MKSLKVLAVCALMAVSGQSFAKQTVTPIVFAKGSSCGAFEGNVAGRVFTLHLKANQELLISVDTSTPIYPIVKDPKGKKLSDVGDGQMFSYTSRQIRHNGKYRITFELEDESYSFAEVKFCAD